MLFKFKDVFGDDFINNTAFVFTHWEQSENAKRVREIKQVSVAKKINFVNEELIKMGFNVNKDLKCFFVDNEIHTYSHEDIIKYKTEDQLEYLNKEVENIFEFV